MSNMSPAGMRRPGTAAGYSRLIDAHILPHFGKAAPAGLTRDAIERWHGAIAQRTPIEANRALAVLSSFLTWLERGGKIAGNPAKGIRRGAENQRHVFLDAGEIAAALAALNADHDRRAALAPVASMIAAMVVPFGRLSSASTDACLDLRVSYWTIGFTCFAFDRLFAADRGFALARALLLDISVGSSRGRGAPSRCTTATPRRPAGAGGGEEPARPGSGLREHH
jgi:hypothetical protein